MVFNIGGGGAAEDCEKLVTEEVKVVGVFPEEEENPLDDNGGGVVAGEYWGVGGVSRSVVRVTAGGVLQNDFI